MDSDLSETALSQHLEAIAARLEIEVRYENLEDDEVSVHSGGCRVLGRNLILIDRRRPLRERVLILARELSRHDLENLYILPQVRDFIRTHSSRREKNLPQI